MTQPAKGSAFSRKSLALICTLLVLAALAASLSAYAGSIHRDLEARLATVPPGTLLPVIVELAEKENPHAAAARVPHFDRRGRGRAVVDGLRSLAARSQPPVLAVLAREQAAGDVHKVYPYWIFNGFALTANERSIRKIAKHPHVREVRLDATFPAPKPRAGSLRKLSSNSEWNLDQIRAPDVWGLDPAYTGAGVVVASFDTGVDGTHPDLAPSYRGNDAISWYDPYGEHASPYDNNGHGTHTTGTMVGGDLSGANIGVAPGARWIAAKGFNDADEGVESAFHQVFQWLLAPGGDPANAPDVVNNSWGLSPPQCFTEFDADIQALRAAGIFAPFASGNSGPSPFSALSPGSGANAFSVGATDEFDEVAEFSSRGPSPCDGSIKPDISAPGVSILSTFPFGFYLPADGTSMATPHVSGTAALLLSINPALTPDDIEAALVTGAVDIGAPGPDNAAGVGRIDAFESARIVLGSPPVVGIVATTATARELGVVPGVFTVTRTGGDTSAALAVTYTASGSATPGADYVALPGSVTIPAGAASATIVVTPIDDTEGELAETVIVTLNNSTGYLTSPKKATVTIVSDELPPDLVVDSTTAPAAGGAGLPVTLGDTTRNQGTTPSAASVTAYYLSTNGAVDASSVRIAGRAVPGLAPGANNSGTVTGTIPAGTAPGTYWVIAKADGDETVVETEELNNVRSRTITIGADLVVWNLGAPASAGAGGAIALTETTTNQGAGNAAATWTSFFLSANAVLDGPDVHLGARWTPPLAPGAADTATTTVTIPAGTPTGVYYIIAQADSGYAVVESSETNNTATRTISIGPDLLVASLVAPATGGAGAPIAVTDTTRNGGGAAAPASSTRFYLSSNPTLDASDVLLGSRAIAPLPAGASDTGTVTLTIPAGTPTGSHYLLAVADGDNVVAETQESNNVYNWLILVGADLTISSFTAPSDTGAGRTIALADTTRNQGGGAAVASTTTFYLSTDWMYDASDVVLGSRAVPALAAGASDSASTTVTIPAGTATGTYYVLARADSAGTVGETYENNNTTYRTVRVGPDLVVANLAAPSSAGAGTTITVTDTTRNNGGGAAPGSSTRFYLSANATLDGGDALLGSRAVPALDAGASNSGSLFLVIPAGTMPATYWLIARADGDDALAETEETNNTYVRSITIGADLAVSSFTAPAASGPGLAITLSDTTTNTAAGGSGPSTTSFYLSTNATLDASDVLLGSRAVPALGAGGSSSGSTVVTIPAGTAVGSYFVIARADAGDAVAELNESNNTLARAIAIGPDLVVPTLTAPATGGAGASIAVSDTTRNDGGAAAGATTTRFYLSSNTTLDAGDVPLGSRAVPSLAPGASSTASTTLVIPAGTVSATYWIFAKADGDDAVAETQEGNNAAFAAIQIGADLTISSFTAPALAGAGLAIAVTDTTRNPGAGAAPASTTAFYLSTNATYDAADVPLGSRAVPALASGASDTATTSVTVPAGTAPGNYFLIARADAGDALPETSESNNVSSRAITIGPDLVVTSLAAPATAGPGATISVTDTTRNDGGGAAAATTTRFYLSTNPVLDAGDVPLGGRAVADLAPAASSTGAASLTIPADTAPRSYYLIAVADGDGLVAEAQEGNNVLSRPITIGTDLAISSFTVPAASGAGAAITVTDTTANTGGGAAAASTTSFYLSSNSTYDASDVPLGSRAVPALAAGASDTASTSLTIPAGTATGMHYVIARADAADAVAELNEGNNTFVRVIAVGPDLVVSSFTAPASGGAGASITVTDTTRNAGGAPAATTTTRFYLSVNASVDVGDAALGGRAVGALLGGASESASTTLAIPAGTPPGTYYLLAVADGDAALAETSETNNVFATTIVIGADLAVTALTVPADGGAGRDLAITDTTRNQGGGAAGASTTTFYLSSDYLLDASDVVLGSRSVPALAAGAADTASTTVTIPAGTATGSYYVIARADSGNSVIELYETNNTLSRTVRIGPDLVVSSLAAPSSAAAGATITVSDTTGNSGGGVAGASTTRIYLSTNLTFDASDVLLGGRAVGVLDPLASSAGPTSVAIPAGTAPGSYYLIAVADGEGVVGETFESNNTRVAFINVTP